MPNKHEMSNFCVILKKKNHLFCILLHKRSVAPYLKYKEFLLPNLVKLAFQAHEPCGPHRLHRHTPPVLGLSVQRSQGAKAVSSVTKTDPA